VTRRLQLAPRFGEAVPAAVDDELVVVPRAALRAMLGAVVREVLDERAGAAPPKVYLSAAEVGEMIGVHAHSVANYTRDRGLPHLRIGRVLRFQREDVERWLAEQARASSTGTAA
jgi:excisionase family DNA binding protein